MADLTIDLGNKIILKNPIMTASGTFGFGDEYGSIGDLGKLGGIVTKAITPEFRKGNLMPRIAETECGMLNSIGLANMGLKEFINKKIPLIEEFNTTVFVNVAGKELKDYLEVAEALNGFDCICGIEVNISCPNVKEGGVAFGTIPSSAAEVTKQVRKVYKKHIMLKLSPNVTDIAEIAKAVEAEGADSVSAVNTYFGMAIDINTFKSKIKSVVSGYSGPGIKPAALAAVYKIANAIKIPVVGMGGIRTYADAIEFILAGASAIQVGTSNFTNPLIAFEMAELINQFLDNKKIEKLSDIIGKFEK